LAQYSAIFAFDNNGSAGTYCPEDKKAPSFVSDSSTPKGVTSDTGHFLFMLSKYAILLDGGFVTKKLQGKLARFPTAAEVEQECQRIGQHPQLANRDLLRIYFYDASPAKDRLTNPIDGSALDLAATNEFRQHMSLLDTLELTRSGGVKSWCMAGNLAPEPSRT
jgi:hypothetical protein